jgi:hypothetical protein
MKVLVGNDGNGAQKLLAKVEEKLRTLSLNEGKLEK